ncbi:PKD domain-containing protein [Cytophagales bacterium LB-30]|uniref:PKD domain-containing protein n=1 Tax=Shiella aurantiaca TaxID=3058365 RepID=A0ABT8F877_9BACT|nr:PKD domain-containing protein [Shiella aurantiaca]MDN4166692.1 PKD domain-containing protein [Shiella aurantiaca]
MKNLLNTRWLLLAATTLLLSCDKEDEEKPTIASFQFEVSAEDFLTVQFTNFSQNAASYSWAFGDETTSTEEDPSHTYAAAGVYTVTLTATGADGSTSQKSEEVTITDPNEALTLLTGLESKTWKLFREGTSMSVGPDASNPAGYWSGLTNNGTRPCLYLQTFTFNRDGSYVFDDQGSFWAEYGVFNNNAAPGCDVNNTPESCFDATAENMVNACGTDVSAWLSGTHSYEYNASTGELTLSGTGAWIGIPKLGTSGIVTEPTNEVKAKITITENEGYDVMLVEFIYAAEYWPIYYVSYSDASLEPELVTDAPVFGEDLADITPTVFGHTFESATSFDELGLIAGGSIITVGQDDPTDANATKVGMFERIATDYQEAQLRTSPDLKDVNFSNFTTVSVDVYLPSTNTYDPLTKKVIIGFADQSQTEQWWTNLIQYESEELALDTWVTVTFQLDAPSFSSTAGQTPFDRTDLDMVFLQIGGGGHSATGTFYVRNLVFE